MENSMLQTDDIQQQEIVFPCEGRCRICPFPGANCAQVQMHTRKQTNPKKIVSKKN